MLIRNLLLLFSYYRLPATLNHMLHLGLLSLFFLSFLELILGLLPLCIEVFNLFFIIFDLGFKLFHCWHLLICVVFHVSVFVHAFNLLSLNIVLLFHDSNFVFKFGIFPVKFCDLIFKISELFYVCWYIHFDVQLTNFFFALIHFFHVHNQKIIFLLESLINFRLLASYWMPLDLLCFDNCLCHHARDFNYLWSKLPVGVHELFDLVIVVISSVLRHFILDGIHLSVYVIQTKLDVLLVKVTGHLEGILVSLEDRGGDRYRDVSSDSAAGSFTCSALVSRGDAFEIRLGLKMLRGTRTFGMPFGRTLSVHLVKKT